MPLYSIQCPECGFVDEFLQAPSEGLVDVSCDKCATIMQRSNHRSWQSDTIGIQGDTCAGSCNMSNYYDAGLGQYINSREHREQVMEEKGLQEYTPDPLTAKFHEESVYIGAHSKAGDSAAVKARQALGKQADTAKKKHAIKKAMGRASTFA